MEPNVTKPKVTKPKATKPKVLNPKATYTFSRYFDLPDAPQDILADLGYSLVRTDQTTLPSSSEALAWLPDLAEGFRRRLQRVNTTTEQARREALIFPVIDRICEHLEYSFNIEYSLSVSNWLKGSLNYFIAAPHNLLVIEAKQADLTKGFLQLAVRPTRLLNSCCSIPFPSNWSL